MVLDRFSLASVMFPRTRALRRRSAQIRRRQQTNASVKPRRSLNNDLDHVFLIGVAAPKAVGWRRPAPAAATEPPSSRISAAPLLVPCCNGPAGGAPRRPPRVRTVVVAADEKRGTAGPNRCPADDAIGLWTAVSVVPGALVRTRLRPDRPPRWLGRVLQGGKVAVLAELAIHRCPRP